MNYYTVYLKKTDEIVVCGTAKECARAMKKSDNSFYSLVSKTNTGKRNKYIVCIEKLDDEEELDDLISGEAY